jgi:hypothetical protein
MGIRLVQTPNSEVDAGVFALPISFDRKEWAAKWVKEGHEVDAAKQPQSIPGSRLVADGWQVFLEGNKPVKRSCTSGVFLLMKRPKVVQQSVNAICGNIGKERTMAQLGGAKTSGGIELPAAESGSLSDIDIARQTGSRRENDGAVILNPVVLDSDRIEQPTILAGRQTEED